MNTIIQGKPHYCQECGSLLILTEVVTFTLGNNPSPIEKSTFRCSNSECQDEADKRAAKRFEVRKLQDLAREERKKQSLALSQK